MTRWYAHLASDDGVSSIVEMLLWLPVCVAILGLLAFAHRFNETAIIAEDTVEAAARAASNGTSAADAVTRGSSSVTESTADFAGTCTSQIDTSRWSQGWVGVDVTCTANVTGLEWVSIGNRTVTRTWAEPLDPVRVVEVRP